MYLLNVIIMEQYIESRVILGLLCLIHLFLNYAGSSGARRGHINRKVLNGVILAELAAVTTYVVYDNLQVPPHNGWLAAILGYLFVYGLIYITWAVYCVYALLDKDKVYEMTFVKSYNSMGGDYFGGTVIEDGHEIEVLLPFKESNHAEKQNVKFKEVVGGVYIIVTPA